jgi:hypothetical protein
MNGWAVILTREGSEPQVVGPFDSETHALAFMAETWERWPQWAFVPTQLKDEPEQPQPWPRQSHLRRAIEAHQQAFVCPRCQLVSSSTREHLSTIEDRCAFCTERQRLLLAPDERQSDLPEPTEQFPAGRLA